MVAELGRLSRQPAEAALVLPASPMDSARTAKLLGTLTPALRDQANALSAELDALQTARASLDAQHKAVAAAAERIAADREALDGVIGRRAQVYAELETAQRGSTARIERLAREAQDIRELLDRLAAESREQETAQRAAREAAALPRAAAAGSKAQRGRSPRPAPQSPRRRAAGCCCRFGQPGESGQPHRGLTIETRSAAQIVAPYDGQIAFAGPFRDLRAYLDHRTQRGISFALGGLGPD